MVGALRSKDLAALPVISIDFVLQRIAVWCSVWQIFAARNQWEKQTYYRPAKVWLINGLINELISSLKLIKERRFWAVICEKRITYYSNNKD